MRRRHPRSQSLSPGAPRGSSTTASGDWVAQSEVGRVTASRAVAVVTPPDGADNTPRAPSVAGGARTRRGCRSWLAFVCRFMALAACFSMLVAFKWVQHDHPQQDQQDKKMHSYVEQACLYTIGALGCSSDLVKEIDKGMDVFIAVFKRKSEGGEEYFSFDFSRKALEDMQTFRQEYNVTFAKVQNSALHHTGLTKPGVQRWIDRGVAESTYPSLVIQKLKEAHMGFQFSEDHLAKSEGYWHYWNETSVSGGGGHQSVSRHSSGIINLRMNMRGYVDVFLAYHESDITVTRRVFGFWGRFWGPTWTHIPVEAMWKSDTTVQETCQWLVYEKILNEAQGRFPKLVQVNRSNE